MTPLARDEAMLKEALRAFNRIGPEDGAYTDYEISACLAALARIVGQARDYEKALREIDAMDSPFGHSRGAFREIARAALAGAGVTDNEEEA